MNHINIYFRYFLQVKVMAAKSWSKLLWPMLSMIDQSGNISIFIFRKYYNTFEMHCTYLNFYLAKNLYCQKLKLCFTRVDESFNMMTHLIAVMKSAVIGPSAESIEVFGVRVANFENCFIFISRRASLNNTKVV